MFFENNRLRALRTTSHNPSRPTRAEEHARAGEVLIAVMTSRAIACARL
jgi:hypothetical protein